MNFLEIIFILVAAILTTIVSYKWKEVGKLGKSALIFVILTAVFVAVNSFRETQKEALIERIKAKYGELQTEGALSPIVMIGCMDNGTSLHLTNGNLNFGGNKPVIKLGVKDEKLLINVIIRDLNGEVIAVIEDSVWTVFNDDYEYNDNDSTFELVTKGERKVFFQAFYRNKMIYISGYILDEKGYGAVMYNILEKYSGTIVNRSVIFIASSEESKKILSKPIGMNIPRIFKYPRDKYYGEKL
jgi:hypothetical protein